MASQSALKDLSKKLDGRIPVRIHFLDNSSKVFLVSVNTTVKEVLQMCLEKFGVLDIEANVGYFGIFESRNGGSIDGCLPMEDCIDDIISSWTDAGVDQTAKFLFMIRLFVPSLWGLQHKDVVAFKINKPKIIISLETYFDEADVIDPNVMHLQFIQAVYNVITGRYPTTPEEAIQLGGIHFLLKFKEYNPESHKVGFLGQRIVEFIPIKHLKSGTTSLEEWEEQLIKYVQQIASKQANSSNNNNMSSHNNKQGEIIYFERNGHPISLQRKYMEIVYSMPYIYGSTFYRCTQRSTRSLPESPFIGIYYQGIHIYDKNKKIAKSFHMEEIYRWGYKPNQVFYFEISAENDLGTGTFEFESPEAKTISDLMTDYAMAFLKEREREENRHEKIKNGSYNIGHINKQSREDKLSNSKENSRNNSRSNSPLRKPSIAPNATVNAKRNQSIAINNSSNHSHSRNQSIAGHTNGTTTHSNNNNNSNNGRKPPPPKMKKSAEVQAAVRIQALFRGFSLRNEWMKEDASILIQSIFRGYRARIRMSNMIEEMINSGEL